MQILSINTNNYHKNQNISAFKGNDKPQKSEHVKELWAEFCEKPHYKKEISSDKFEKSDKIIEDLWKEYNDPTPWLVGD